MNNLSSPEPSNHDQDRDRLVYLYLLNNLTDLGTSESRPKPNEYSISQQWGQKNRIFVRRVLRSVMGELYEEKDREDRVPGLTLSKLVEILASLQDYRQKDSVKKAQTGNLRPITQTEKERVLQKYSQLFPEERKKLGISIHPQASLLEQLINIVTDPLGSLSDITNFYKQALDLYTSLSQPTTFNSEGWENLESIIKARATERVEQYYGNLTPSFQKEATEHLVKKVLVEVSRDELQAGIEQARHGILEPPAFVSKNLQIDSVYNQFLHNLVDSVIQNDLLSNELPIYIDYVEIDNIDPLPLKIDQDNNYSGLINSYFLGGIDREKNYPVGLEKQKNIRVKVHFYLHPKSWQPKFTKEMSPFFKQENTKNRLDFCEEVIGIGSPISHITTAINRFLFEDISVLEQKGYLPIAQKILSEDRIIGNPRNSVVLSYTLVKLCHQDNIQQALSSDASYDQIAVDQELALGEYYGFDLLEAAAKSALYARLRAIQQSEVNNQEYLDQLCERIEEKYILKKAESYINFYPFSLLAMQDYLNKNLFTGKYRNWNKQDFTFTEVNKNWSLVAYEAHLKIIQAYLQEGLYGYGKKYLDLIEPHIQAGKLQNKLLLGLYHLCLFRYHFATDLQDRNREHEQRGGIIRKAEECLDRAEGILKDYLRDYALIGEYTQTNAHPFFYYLSRVYAHRAKLYIFFPYIAKAPDPQNLLIEPIYLLEKARIYAARDGNSHHYAYWTIYQAWCYVIVAYLGSAAQVRAEFNREKCLDWARKLVINAIDCYALRGKLCYQEIKDNSGKQTHDQYGDVAVGPIPPIIEVGGSNYLDEFYRELLENNADESKTLFLKLPMSVLSYGEKYPANKTYFFGVHASILLFGLGLVELAADLEEEKLERDIIMAMRRFTMVAAIASEGTEYVDGQTLHLKRKFTDSDVPGKLPEDFMIKGLYPHRLTHFTLLGKIFAAAARVILWLYDSQRYPYWEEVVYLLSDLYDVRTIERSQPPAYLRLQSRYNGHLEEQITRIKPYLEQYAQSTATYPNLTAIRNKILTDVFKILRGDKASS